MEQFIDLFKQEDVQSIQETVFGSGGGWGYQKNMQPQALSPCSNNQSTTNIVKNISKDNDQDEENQTKELLSETYKEQLQQVFNEPSIISDEIENQEQLEQDQLKEISNWAWEWAQKVSNLIQTIHKE